jgi:hypothetical protein
MPCRPIGHEANGGPAYTCDAAIQAAATLIGASVAICAAIVGGIFINKQIRYSERLAEEQRARAERAAKAVLPLALADLSQYARDCVRFLDTAIGPGTGDPRLPVDLQPPRVPENSVGPLQTCAQFADPENSDKIAKALGKLQIQQSRLRGWISKHRGGRLTPLRRQEGYGYMWDAADLEAAIAALFEYSRDVELVSARASIQEITSALRNSNVLDDEHPVWNVVRARGQQRRV